MLSSFDNWSRENLVFCDTKIIFTVGFKVSAINLSGRFHHFWKAFRWCVFVIEMEHIDIIICNDIFWQAALKLFHICEWLSRSILIVSLFRTPVKKIVAVLHYQLLWIIIMMITQCNKENIFIWNIIVCYLFGWNNKPCSCVYLY